jgi:hypothetical protein
MIAKISPGVINSYLFIQSRQQRGGFVCTYVTASNKVHVEQDTTHQFYVNLGIIATNLSAYLGHPCFLLYNLLLYDTTTSDGDVSTGLVAFRVQMIVYVLELRVLEWVLQLTLPYLRDCVLPWLLSLRCGCNRERRQASDGGDGGEGGDGGDDDGDDENGDNDEAEEEEDNFTTSAIDEKEGDNDGEEFWGGHIPKKPLTGMKLRRNSLFDWWRSPSRLTSLAPRVRELTPVKEHLRTPRSRRVCCYPYITSMGRYPHAALARALSRPRYTLFYGADTDDYLKVTMQCALVVLFGLLCPSLVCLSLILGRLEARFDLLKLLFVFRRPLPRRVDVAAHAAWHTFLLLVMGLGAVLNVGVLLWLHPSNAPYLGVALATALTCWVLHSPTSLPFSVTYTSHAMRHLVLKPIYLDPPLVRQVRDEVRLQPLPCSGQQWLASVSEACWAPGRGYWSWRRQRDVRGAWTGRDGWDW